MLLHVGGIVVYTHSSWVFDTSVQTKEGFSTLFAFCIVIRKILLVSVLGYVFYHNNPEYWNRHAFANSVDPDQMLQNGASDQGLHFLLYMQQYYRHQEV